VDNIDQKSDVITTETRIDVIKFNINNHPIENGTSENQNLKLPDRMSYKNLHFNNTVRRSPAAFYTRTIANRAAA